MLSGPARDVWHLHKALGGPMATWNDGQVVWIQPKDIVVDLSVEGDEAPRDPGLW